MTTQPATAFFRLEPVHPEDVCRSAFGTVTRSGMINPRTGRGEHGGVLCPVLFGSEQDWECACGRLRGPAEVGYVCIRCDQPVVQLVATRWGMIELTSPAVHPLLIRPLARLLNYTPDAFRRVVSYRDAVVIEPGASPLRPGTLVSWEEEYRVREEIGPSGELDYGIGACRRLLDKVRITELRRHLWQRLEEEIARTGGPRGRRARHLLARLRVVDAIWRAAPDDPDGWARRLFLESLPVLPLLRRWPAEWGGTNETADLTTQYGTIFLHCERLRRLVDLNAPEVIVRNERRLLQRAVEHLFDNETAGRPALGWRRRRLRSLADRLRGSTLRNLTTKRVDYSAAAAVVPDPGVAFDACGLPLEVAEELFRPWLLAEAQAALPGPAGKRAGVLVELLKPLVTPGVDEAFLAGRRLYREWLADLGTRRWTLLEEVLDGRRIVIQRGGERPRPLPALRPVLVPGRALRIHPRMAGMLDLGSDTETVTVHLPLSNEAQEEAEVLLRPEHLGEIPFLVTSLRPGTETPPGGPSGGSPVQRFFRAAQRDRRGRLERMRRTARATELRRRLAAALGDVFIREADCGRAGEGRGVLTCRSRRGVCQRCFGVNPGTGRPVELGTRVGLQAALALTHEIGWFTSDLSELERLFEARPADGERVLTDEGLCERILRLYQDQGRPVDRRFVEILVAAAFRFVRIGRPGDGGLIRGTVLTVRSYRRLVRRLRRSCVVTGPGDSPWQTGQCVDLPAFEEECARRRAAGQRPPAAREPVLPRARRRVLGVSEMVRYTNPLTALLVEEPLLALGRAALLGRTEREDSMRLRAWRGLPGPGGHPDAG